MLAVLIAAPAHAQDLTGTVSSTTTPVPEPPGEMTAEAPPSTEAPSSDPAPAATDSIPPSSGPDASPSPAAPPTPVAPPVPPPVPTVPPEVLAEINAGRADLDRLTQALTDAEHERVRFETLFRTNQVRAGAARAHLDQTKMAIERRAVAAYKGHHVQLLDIVLASENVDSLSTRRLTLEAVFAADVEALNEYRDAQDRLAQEEIALRGLTEQQRQAETEARARADELRTRLGQLDQVVKTRLPGASARPPIPVNGFVFPVGQPHSFTRDFGDYRSGPPVHSHQGTDIFAPFGTPLFAVVDGTVQLSEGGLGGRMVVLYSADGSGTYYLYAHLQDWPEGMVSGTAVRAGQVIGFNGDTGNALGAPHCHFEVHPNGGAAVDPYELLTSTDRGATQALLTPSAPVAPAPVTDAVTALPDPPDVGPID